MFALQYVAAVVACGLFAYLTYALLYPERF